MLLWRAHMSVASLARQIGRDRSAFSLKLNGHRRWYLDELIEIAAELDTSVGFLLGETDDDRRPEHLQSTQKAPTASAVGADGVGRAGLEPATDGL
ncbi:helix-turn-helix domain-containing protein [Leucobacter chromiiresistens]